MKHKHWHKIWHDRLLSDPDYQALPPAARGVLADLRCLAGRTDDHGRTGQTAKTLLHWYGGNHDAVETALKSLGNHRLIAVEPETEVIRIPNWDEAQESPAAARQRRYMERQKARHNDANMTGHTDGRGRLTDAESPNPLPVSQEIEQLAFRVFGHAPLANLSEWIGLHGVESVQAALLETERAGARSPNYTNKVLQSWARNGRSKGNLGNGGNGHAAPEKVKLYDPQNAFAD